jgi:hypothetical protein
MGRPARPIGAPHDHAHKSILFEIVGLVLAVQVVGQAHPHAPSLAAMLIQGLSSPTGVPGV